MHPSVPVTTVKELIALAARKPGELNYGSSGTGGFGHMSTELFSVMTKIRMTQVPYKGVAMALSELVGGQIHVLFNSAVVTIPQIKVGRVRVLATTGRYAIADTTGGTDGGRSGRAGLREHDLVDDLGAGTYTCLDRRALEPGAGRGAALSGDQGTIRRRRLHRDRRHTRVCVGDIEIGAGQIREVDRGRRDQACG